MTNHGIEMKQDKILFLLEGVYTPRLDSNPNPISINTIVRAGINASSITINCSITSNNGVSLFSFYRKQSNETKSQYKPVWIGFYWI